MKLKKVTLTIAALALLTVGQSAFATPSIPSDINKIQTNVQTQSTTNIYANSPQEPYLYMGSYWEDHNTLSVNYSAEMSLPGVMSYVPTGSTISSATLYVYLRSGYAPDPNMEVLLAHYPYSQYITSLNLSNNPGWVAIDITSVVQNRVNSNDNSALGIILGLTSQHQYEDVSYVWDGPTGINKPYLAVSYTP